ncbi:hypothetical protein B0H16DRAFT_1876905 [Mycena metata]|uniref:UBC core domain-containing protein n=1 Tax=Mycena metata TaxID=1033252 RepID=A0AAD7KFB7_9AGAR|nr:hypothetical protein B0H16DRAFT_1876905 [Mycena metata]
MGNVMAPPSLLSRLYKDLAELYESPYPGITVFTDDADVRNFCLVLTPASGPWKHLSLHFDVSPSPPKVSSSVNGIAHPNVFGSYVCCDLLKTKAEIYRGDGYTGGHSPALILRWTVLAVLALFQLYQDYGHSVTVGDSVTVRYVRDELTPVGRKRRQLVFHVPLSIAGHPGQKVVPPTQDELRREWEQSTKPVVVVRREMSEVGPLLETVKSTGPGSTRLRRIEEQNYRWTSTFHAIRSWKCRHYMYGTAAVPHCVGPVAKVAVDADQSSPLLTPPVVCQLGLLNDDVLYEMALRLLSESLVSFSAAYPRLHDIVQSTHVLLQRELRCFFLRTSLSESILGIGVAFDSRSRTLSSDFDWLSQRAFVEFGVRESVEKRDFAFFLPLAFSRPHFQRAYTLIWKRLQELDSAVQKAENTTSRNPRRRAAGSSQPQEIIGVVYKMMNNIVISLMKSCDTALTAAGSSTQTLLHASEKAVIAYCHLFHLVICLYRSDPKIMRDATLRLHRFIDRKDTRVKKHVPDLGELIILIMLVLCRPPVGDGPAIKWANLAGPFLEEVIVRNVRWVLKDAPQLEVMEQGASDYRLAETFFRSKTGLRLVMFQITFLDLFFKACGSDISRLDNNYGFPEKELPERMVEEVKVIYTINTWPAFLRG